MEGKGEGNPYSTGCTACVALLTPNMLFVANAGDSRCVISVSGRTKEMSFDHKPDNP
jgi:serine/threonine protein phosphatase PrpC